MNYRRVIAQAVVGVALTVTGAWGAERQMERLGRGVVAVAQKDGKVFVGWRMVGTDSEKVAFNLYRTTGNGEAVKLNERLIDNVTWFLDEKADRKQGNKYHVRAVENGRESAPSAPWSLPPASPPPSPLPPGGATPSVPPSQGASSPPASPPSSGPYFSIPLKTPEGYTPNDASAGDLDGDGEYEIVLHQTGRGKDNSQNGETDPPILQGYRLDGKMLWEINLGKNVREGAHYTQFMVYDLDGDGRAEVVCKTADGTKDGAGKVIGDPRASYVDEGGRVLKGPEFLTVFDGMTGKELATTKYVPARDDRGSDMKAIWGDNYGNRADRFLACVAYLDGVRPSVVMARGYYTRAVLAAWDWRDGKLTQRWVFDSSDRGNEKYAGQGNHNLSVADVDGDGKDEILYGGCAIDDNGKGLWTTELGHGDAMHVSDLDPSNPGMEMFRIQERFGDAGAHLVDAKTGKVLWRVASVKAAEAGGDKGEGPGRGVALDVDPRYPGAESWVAGAGIRGMFNAKGEKIGEIEGGRPVNETTPSCNFGIWWDGDVLRELLDGTKIDKWDWETKKPKRLLSGHDYGCASNNGTKANPCLSADILGDWREEVIWRSSDNKELRVFVSTIPTDRRFVTFMHDPVYRLGIAWQNVAYNQPPHTSFYVGEGMKEPARARIRVVEGRK